MFWNKFYDLCTKENSKPNPIGKKIGISSATITQWKQGTLPDREALVKISDYFNCSIDYLLGRTDNPQARESGSIELSEDKQRLLKLYDLLTDMEKGEIIGEIKVLTRGRAEAKKEETA